MAFRGYGVCFPSMCWKGANLGMSDDLHNLCSRLAYIYGTMMKKFSFLRDSMD